MVNIIPQKYGGCTVIHYTHMHIVLHDPKKNLELSTGLRCTAMQAALKDNLPKDTIDRRIKAFTASSVTQGFDGLDNGSIMN